MTFEERMVEKFIGLIKSAGRLYFKKSIPSSYFDYEDFEGRGFLTLAVCLAKWKNRDDEQGFSKYFKTSLFHKYQSMLGKAFAKKRDVRVGYKDFRIVQNGKILRFPKIFYNPKSWEPSGDWTLEALYHNKWIIIDSFTSKETAESQKYEISQHTLNFVPFSKEVDIDKLPSDGGFGEIEFKELIEHVLTKLTNKLEKKIFEIWVDPPEDLCTMALMENHRKVRVSLANKSKGSNQVRLSNDLVIKYLKKRGFRISAQAYSDHFKDLKCKVKRLIRESDVA